MSVRKARHPGNIAASAAVTTRMSKTAASTSGSNGRAYTGLSANSPPIRTPEASPQITPPNSGNVNCFISVRTIEYAFAPSDIRIPISLRRRVAANETVPKIPMHVMARARQARTKPSTPMARDSANRSLPVCAHRMRIRDNPFVRGD